MILSHSTEVESDPSFRKMARELVVCPTENSDWTVVYVNVAVVDQLRGGLMKIEREKRTRPHYDVLPTHGQYVDRPRSPQPTRSTPKKPSRRCREFCLAIAAWCGNDLRSNLPPQEWLEDYVGVYHRLLMMPAPDDTLKNARPRRIDLTSVPAETITCGG